MKVAYFPKTCFDLTELSFMLEKYYPTREFGYVKSYGVNKKRRYFNN